MAFPATPKPNGIKITSVTPTLVSETHNLKRQVRQRGAQRWAIEASYSPMTRSQFAPIWAFVISKKGRYSTFSYIAETISNSSSSATGTLSTSASASSGAATVSATGLTGSLKAGDFIKFSGHDKVYLLISDGSSGLAFEPPLMASVASGESITYNSVPFTMALANDAQEASLDINNLNYFSLELIEVL
jgi:hypothetical protein